MEWSQCVSAEAWALRASLNFLSDQLPHYSDLNPFVLAVLCPCSLVLEELPMPSVGPRIVVQRKLGAVLRAGMVIKPELDERIRVRIFQPRLAQRVERGDRCLLR